MSLRDDIRRPASAKPSVKPGRNAAAGRESRIRMDGTGAVTHRQQRPQLTETRIRKALATPVPAGPAPTPGWKLLARGALAAALVVGLATQVSGHGREVQTDVTARISVAREAIDASRQAFADGDLTAAEDQLGVAQHSLHDANRSIASLGQQGGIAFSQASGDRTVAVELLATGERFITTARETVREVRTIPDAAAKHDKGFYAAGEILNQRLPAITEHVAELDRQLALLGALSDRAADSDLEQLRTAGAEFKRILPAAKQSLQYGTELTEALPGILGEDEFRRYLVWFQNPAELRPTGGFVGTLGELTLDRGTVKELQVDSIYSVANQANSRIKEPPPAPFLRFARRDPPIWAFQDANWSPDFPTAARRFQDFYEQAGRSTTDGVVAVTVTPIEDMLRVLGPIAMPEYGYTLTADNFQTTIQDDQKERRSVRDKDPKKILRDFVPMLLQKLGDAPDAQRTKALAVLTKAARSGDVQLFFNRDAQERLLGNAKATGAHRPYAGGISLIDANIAGFKSSRDITTVLERRVTVSADGRVKESVAVTREHSGATETHDNLNYTRLYLPPETETGSVTGWNALPIANELEGWGPVLGGWTDVARFDERTYGATFSYGRDFDLRSGRLPLRYIAQPGTKVKVKTTATLPDGFVWDGRSGATVEGRRLTVSDTARGDLVYDLTFRQTRP